MPHQFRGLGPDLVEERQRAVGHLEEHRVPARMPGAVGLHAGRDLDRRRPRAFHLPRHPDADVRRALARAAEPGRDEPAARLGDRGRVHARERRRLEKEFGLHDRRGAATAGTAFPSKVRANGVSRSAAATIAACFIGCPQQRLADEEIPDDLVNGGIRIQAAPEYQVLRPAEGQAAEKEQAVAHGPLIEVHDVGRILPRALVGDEGHEEGQGLRDAAAVGRLEPP